MKHLLFFGLSLLLLSACNNNEAHRPAVEALNTQWQETTTQVTELAGQIQADQVALAQTIEGLSPDMEALAKVKDADKVEAVQTTFAEWSKSIIGFASISTEISLFVEDWTAKSATVEALVAGLSSGNYEGDIPAQIEELNNALTMAATRMSNWQKEYEQAKSTAQETQAAYQAAYDAAFPAN